MKETKNEKKYKQSQMWYVRNEKERKRDQINMQTDKQHELNNEHINKRRKKIKKQNANEHWNGLLGARMQSVSRKNNLAGVIN